MALYVNSVSIHKRISRVITFFNSGRQLIIGFNAINLKNVIALYGTNELNVERKHLNLLERTNYFKISLVQRSSQTLTIHKTTRTIYNVITPLHSNPPAGGKQLFLTLVWFININILITSAYDVQLDHSNENTHQITFSFYKTNTNFMDKNYM
mgnify:CR=1 FL=1